MGLVAWYLAGALQTPGLCGARWGPTLQLRVTLCSLHGQCVQLRSAHVDAEKNPWPLRHIGGCSFPYHCSSPCKVLDWNWTPRVRHGGGRAGDDLPTRAHAREQNCASEKAPQALWLSSHRDTGPTGAVALDGGLQNWESSVSVAYNYQACDITSAARTV